MIQSSGISGYIESRPVYVGRERPERGAERHDGGPAEIHYHNHMNLPQGVVVSDIERFGRTVQPYVERGTLLAERRRRRGKPRL